MAKIPNSSKDAKVSAIVFDKFPHLNFSKRNNFFSPTPLPEHLQNASESALREEVRKMEEYRSKVNGYAQEKIDELYKVVEVREIKRSNAEIEKAENLIFHQPHMNANYDFWNKADYWKPEEFLALSFGKEPKYLTKKYVEANQFGGMYLSEFAILQFPVKYLERFELMERSRVANPKNVNLPPEDVRLEPKDCIKWAQNKGIKFPDELLKFKERVKQTNNSIMTKLPQKLHSNIIKVLKYIDDQLEQSYGDTVELNVMMFGKNPTYIFEGFEALNNRNILVNFGNISEQISKILLKLEDEFKLISITESNTNSYGNISSFKIIVAADFKTRTKHLLEDRSTDLGIEKLKAQLQEKENEIEKLTKEKTDLELHNKSLEENLRKTKQENETIKHELKQKEDSRVITTLYKILCGIIKKHYSEEISRVSKIKAIALNVAGIDLDKKTLKAHLDRALEEDLSEKE